MADNNQFKLDLSPETATGSYSNLAIISHSRSEFIIDFASALPGLPQPKINNRIIMAPEHCKRLLGALADNISKYESQFGEISTDDVQRGGTFNLADMNPGGTRS